MSNLAKEKKVNFALLEVIDLMEFPSVKFTNIIEFDDGDGLFFGKPEIRTMEQLFPLQTFCQFESKI